MLTFVIGAEMIFIPGLRVAAIAASTSVSFELHPMAGVVALFKAVFTNDTGWIFLTVHTAPCHITIVDLLGTDSHRDALVHLEENELVI